MVGNGRIKFTPHIFMLSPLAHALMQSLITVCHFYFFPRVLEGHKSSETTSSIERDKWMRRSAALLKIHVLPLDIWFMVSVQ